MGRVDGDRTGFGLQLGLAIAHRAHNPDSLLHFLCHGEAFVLTDRTS